MHFAPLGANLFALRLRQAGQELLEMVIGLIAPVKLHAIATKHAGSSDRLPIVIIGKQHVQGRHARFLDQGQGLGQ